MFEMKAIEDNGMWELVNPPLGCRLIGLKWVFQVKRDKHGAIAKHMARHIARGFVQQEGIDFEEVSCHWHGWNSSTSYSR